MVANPSPRRYTYAEYLERERETAVKLEFLRGEVWAMAGGSFRHAALSVNVVTAFSNALQDRGGCRAYNSDLKIRPNEDFAAYADAAIVCGAIEHAEDDRNGATNPTVIVEVLSPSTERYDRGPKFLQYQRIASLRDYLLVSTDAIRVERFERVENSWVYRVYENGQRVELSSLGIVLYIEGLYRNLPDD